MNNPYISICIPVHNMEPYIRDCLDSIRTQSFTDWEVICTDDGATDESGTILDEYARSDDRIKVIHQKNGGLCSARNAALRQAKGKWLWFVDADDVILKGALQIFYDLSVSDSYDGFCISDFISFVDRCDVDAHGSGALIASIPNPGLGTPLFFQKKWLWGLPFARIVRRETFEKVKFIDGLKYLEDSIQLIEMMSLRARWAFVDCTLYGYRQRSDSISHGYKKGKCALELKSFKLLFEKARDGLGMGEKQFERFVERKRGSMNYYLWQGFRREDEQGLRIAAAAYDELCALIGHWHVSVFYELRLALVKLGIHCYLSRIVGTLEYLYYGTRAHLLKAMGKEA